ncbi:MAG: capsule biosynthesis protein, partial [Sphingobium sp. 32-64-5]
MSRAEQVKAALADPRMRRRAYAAGALLLAVLCVVPQPYVARSKVVPQDVNSLGLGSMTSSSVGGFSGVAALLGGAKQPVDLYLAMARSSEVSGDVIKRLKLVEKGEYASERSAQVALSRMVDIHSLTGGIIEIETRGHDAAETEALTKAYSDAISDRIVTLGRDRTERKRNVIEKRFAEASAKVSTAEAALEAFRRKNNLAAPEAQLCTEISLRAGLQAQLQAK